MISGICDLLLRFSESFRPDIEDNEVENSSSNPNKSLAIEALPQQSIEAVNTCGEHIDNIPIAEIVICANIVLTLVRIASKNEDARRSVCSFLPQSTWALPIRILKAFLNLQCKVSQYWMGSNKCINALQTGVFVRESLEEVVNALKSIDPCSSLTKVS